ncbi:hypothetical protein EGW08_019320 [Elysia chlorotica]|uniref:Small integral membrane protein 4 n=1 Tax=Elysia chlorotica TaxID=188477 RepID=A0A3S0ZQH7_ELYCH|nr:hypothetical protein EGW08_019320 [Elysia chlorotica]
MRRLFSFVESFVKKWPGKRYFGVYRFMPLFFVMGATVEFAMIKWRPLGVNFYDVYKNKEAARIAEEESAQ